MARLDNWQNNLSELIDNRRNEAFDFPTHNCLFWVMAAIQAVNGLDLAAPYGGKAPDEKAAARAMRRIDKVKTSEELLAKYLGEFQPIAFARQGDIVFLSPDGDQWDLPADLRLFGPVPGVCYGSISFFLGKHGLISIPTLQLDKALWVS